MCWVQHFTRTHPSSNLSHAKVPHLNKPYDTLFPSINRTTCWLIIWHFDAPRPRRNSREMRNSLRLSFYITFNYRVREWTDRDFFRSLIKSWKIIPRVTQQSISELLRMTISGRKHKCGLTYRNILRFYVVCSIQKAAGETPRLLFPTLSIRIQAPRYTMTKLSFQLPSLILERSKLARS